MARLFLTLLPQDPKNLQVRGADASGKDKLQTKVTNSHIAHAKWETW